MNEVRISLHSRRGDDDDSVSSPPIRVFGNNMRSGGVRVAGRTQSPASMPSSSSSSSHHPKQPKAKRSVDCSEQLLPVAAVEAKRQSVRLLTYVRTNLIVGVAVFWLVAMSIALLFHISSSSSFPTNTVHRFVMTPADGSKWMNLSLPGGVSFDRLRRYELCCKHEGRFTCHAGDDCHIYANGWASVRAPPDAACELRWEE